MNNLLNNFEGQSDTIPKIDTDNYKGDLFWKPVFGINRELEKMFHDVGGTLIFALSMATSI